MSTHETTEPAPGALSEPTDSPKYFRILQEPKSDVMWLRYTPEGRACYTMEALAEMLSNCRHMEATGRASATSAETTPVGYYVTASDVPGVFGLGGDLFLFRRLIKARDRAGLLQYATRCVDIQWSILQHFGHDITTIALVQGRALGGGMEGAIACDYVIAERCATFGVPEIKFGLFPGMGAYSILSRKVGRRKAEELMASGEILSASEAFELGIVDVLVEDGQGVSAVESFIRKHRRNAAGLRAIVGCRAFQNPITYEELLGITTLWADTALRVSDQHLRLIDMLIYNQDRLAST